MIPSPAPRCRISGRKGICPEGKGTSGFTLENQTESRQILEQSLAIWRTLGAAWETANLLFWLGYAVRHLGRLRRSATVPPAESGDARVAGRPIGHIRLAPWPGQYRRAARAPRRGGPSGTRVHQDPRRRSATVLAPPSGLACWAGSVRSRENTARPTRCCRTPPGPSVKLGAAVEFQVWWMLALVYVKAHLGRYRGGALPGSRQCWTPTSNAGIHGGSALSLSLLGSVNRPRGISSRPKGTWRGASH